MKHKEARERYYAIQEIINYLAANKIDLFHLNYALDRNLEIFKKEEERILKNAPAELKDLEKKIIELGKEKAEKGQVNYWEIGKQHADPADIEKQQELYKQFEAQLEEESEVRHFGIDLSRIENLPIDYIHTKLLMLFEKTQ